MGIIPMRMKGYLQPISIPTATFMSHWRTRIVIGPISTTGIPTTVDC